MAPSVIAPFEWSEPAMVSRDVKFFFFDCCCPEQVNEAMASSYSTEALMNNRPISDAFKELPDMMELAREYARSTTVEGSLDQVMESWVMSRSAPPFNLFNSAAGSWRLLIYLLRHSVAPSVIIRCSLNPYLLTQWCHVNFFALGYLIGTSQDKLGSNGLAPACLTYIIAGNGYYLLHLFPWNMRATTEALEKGSPEALHTAVALCFRDNIEPEELPVCIPQVATSQRS